MLNLVQNAFLLGLGATSLTLKKAEEFISSAIKDNNLTPDEGKQLLQTFIDEGKRSEEAIRAKVEEVIASKGESLLPCAKKVADLEARIAALEAEIAALKQPAAPEQPAAQAEETRCAGRGCGCGLPAARSEDAPSARSPRPAREEATAPVSAPQRTPGVRRALRLENQPA